MLNYDQFKYLFGCDLCNQLLADPITLLCGNTVCKNHIQQLLISGSLIGCTLCRKNHTIPEDGFKINKEIQSAFDAEIKKLKSTLEYFECSHKIETVTELLRKFETISKAPSVYINARFEEIKSRVNCRRADIKKEIDKYGDGLIQSIEHNRFNCIELFKESFQLADLDEKEQTLEVLRKDLYELGRNDLINDASFQYISMNADALKNELNTIVEYQKSLVPAFEFVLHPMAHVFGKITVKTNIEQTSVKSLIEDPSDTQVEVLQKLEPEFDSQAISQPEQDANKKIFFRFEKKYKAKYPQMAYEGHIYIFKRISRSRKIYYYCKNRSENNVKCLGALFITPDLKFTRKFHHNCNGNLNFTNEDATDKFTELTNKKQIIKYIIKMGCQRESRGRFF